MQKVASSSLAGSNTQHIAFMLTIDGSQGEGGGQIVRTSLALSLVTGTPIRIVNLRAGRARPGLARQHVTAVRAAAEVGAAEVEGAAVGSREVTFRPTGLHAGAFRFSVGSAGSTTLVLQTILPALLTGKVESSVTLEGGTHNPHAPTFDYLDRVYLPVIERMGPRVSAKLERPGFAPAGGGRCVFHIQPSRRLAPIDLLKRGETRSVRATAMIANLPEDIAERELKVVRKKLGWREQELRVEPVHEAHGPGNVLQLEIESQHAREMFTSFGRLGVRAERVAGEAVDEALRYLDADVPVGEHLADQLLLPLALAGGGSFRTLPLSSHAWTHIKVIREFLDVAISVDEDDGGRSCVVRVAKGG